MPTTRDRATACVGVVNSSVDCAELLAEALTDRGYRAVATALKDLQGGRGDFDEFLARYSPGLLIFHIDPPYEENVAAFKALTSEGPLRVPVVVTSTHPNVAEEVVPTYAERFFVKPYELSAIMQAVEDILARNPERPFEDRRADAQ